MLSVGDMSDLESALLNLIKVAEGTEKMLKPIIGAIAYPSFLLLMSVLVIYAIGAYMVPPMMDAECTMDGNGERLGCRIFMDSEKLGIGICFFPGFIYVDLYNNRYLDRPDAQSH